MAWIVASQGVGDIVGEFQVDLVHFGGKPLFLCGEVSVGWGVDSVARERVESEMCLSLRVRGISLTYIARGSHCPPMRCVCH